MKSIRWWAFVPTVIGLLLLLSWGCLLLWFQIESRWLAVGLSLIWASAILAPVFSYFLTSNLTHWWIYPVFLIALIAMLSWWSQLTPTHDRQWSADVAQLLNSRIDGNQVYLSNVRNFSWQTKTQFTPRWQSGHYDLDKLQSADLVLSYWMGPAIAHTLVSFSFTDGERLVFSLEIRKERHEVFSALAGFFKRYEQVLIAATEQDILYLRTNVRQEDVYLYRLNLDNAQLRNLFLAYLNEAASIKNKAAFYNSLTSNCTTIIYQLAKSLVPGLPFDYRIVLSGYLPSYVYELGGMAADIELSDLQQQAAITQKSQTVENLNNYSTLIRQGVPATQSQARSRMEHESATTTSR